MKYNFDTRGFYSLNTIGNSVILNAENDEEEKLLGEIEKTIKNKINRLKNSGYEVNHIESKNLSKLTLFECFKRFYRTQEHTQHKKYLTKFRQVSKLLFMFFGENRNIQTIEPKEVRDFLDFLLRMPKNVARIKELQDKNIKLLIEKNSPLLDKYEKVSPSSVDEHIKKCKTMFNYFLDCQYIYTNPFLKIKKQSTPRTQSHTNWLPFKTTELKNLLKKTKIDTKYREEYNLMKFCLFTGFRRTEMSLLKCSNVDLEKGFIDFDFEISKIKTENSKRIVPIHREIYELLQEQIKDKDSNDFLFFNNKEWKGNNRSERIGNYVNKRILDYFGNDKEKKKHYNIHSIRKNFIQTLVFSDLFSELDYKTIIGHSTQSDITDKHYLMGKRNYKSYKSKMDRVDFSEFM